MRSLSKRLASARLEGVLVTIQPDEEPRSLQEAYQIQKEVNLQMLGKLVLHRKKRSLNWEQRSLAQRGCQNNLNSGMAIRSLFSPRMTSG